MYVCVCVCVRLLAIGEDLKVAWESSEQADRRLFPDAGFLTVKKCCPGARARCAVCDTRKREKEGGVCAKREKILNLRATSATRISGTYQAGAGAGSIYTRDARWCVCI